MYKFNLYYKKEKKLKSHKACITQKHFFNPHKILIPNPIIDRIGL